MIQHVKIREERHRYAFLSSTRVIILSMKRRNFTKLLRSFILSFVVLHYAHGMHDRTKDDMSSDDLTNVYCRQVIFSLSLRKKTNVSLSVKIKFSIIHSCERANREVYQIQPLHLLLCNYAIYIEE